MDKITLSMIVKNEEALLPGCLKSVKDFVDDIQILDTGSTDSTVDIAHSFGATVYHGDWVDDFGASRNLALSFVRTPWTLWLDADDLVENPHFIPQLIEAATPDITGYWSKYMQDQTSQQRRFNLFRTDAYKWEGVVHEGLVPTNPDNNATRLSNLVVLHRKPKSRSLGAARKYLDILLAKAPDNWFGIAESYRFLTYEGDPAQTEQNALAALSYYNQAMQAKGVNKPTQYICYINLSRIALKLFEITSDRKWLVYAHKTAHASVLIDQSRAEGWSLQAQSELYNGDLSAAHESCEYALMTERPEDTTGLFYYDFYHDIPKRLQALIKEQVAKPEHGVVT